MVRGSDQVAISGASFWAFPDTPPGMTQTPLEGLCIFFGLGHLVITQNELEDATFLLDLQSLTIGGQWMDGWM